MKVIKTTVLFIFILIGCFNYKNCLAQSISEKPDSVTTRTVFFAIGAGYPEYISLRLGGQINAKFSLALKLGLYADGQGRRFIPWTGFWCLKGAYYFKSGFLNINNVALNIGYSDATLGRGNYVVDVSAGYETTENKFFYVYWAATLAAVASADGALFLTPGITTGFIFNL